MDRNQTTCVANYFNGALQSALVQFRLPAAAAKIHRFTRPGGQLLRVYVDRRNNPMAMDFTFMHGIRLLESPMYHPTWAEFILFSLGLVLAKHGQSVSGMMSESPFAFDPYVACLASLPHKTETPRSRLGLDASSN